MNIQKRESGAKQHNGWQEFEQAFNLRYPGSLSRLAKKYSTLTSQELHVCAMLRESMSTLEIADTLYISYRTVENHRTNIRRKLGIKGNGQHDLARFLLKF